MDCLSLVIPAAIGVLAGLFFLLATVRLIGGDAINPFGPWNRGLSR